MAKQGRLLPARPREAADESVLIRSAETLGRMIGSLQRQLDGATKRLSSLRGGSADGASVEGDGHRGPTRSAEPTRAKPRSGARAAGVGRTASGARKTQSAADRKSKRASKSARAKKTATRRGSRKTAAGRNGR